MNRYIVIQINSNEIYPCLTGFDTYKDAEKFLEKEYTCERHIQELENTVVGKCIGNYAYIEYNDQRTDWRIGEL